MVLSSRDGDDALTSKGLDLLRLPRSLCSSPWPSRPWPPTPQLQRKPPAVRARLCNTPADTLTARSPPSGEGRRVGVLSRVTPSPWPRRPGAGRHPREPHDESRPSPSMKTLCCFACRRPRRRVGLAQQRRIAQPPHGAALALWLRRQLEAALLRPQADALLRKRGVEEQRDGRDASDVDGGRSERETRTRSSVGRSRRRAGGGASSKRWAPAWRTAGRARARATAPPSLLTSWEAQSPTLL